MNTFTDFLTILCWFLTFLVAPFALGIGICRALRVKEFATRTAWVTFSIFLAFAPLAAKIVQEERFAYKTDAGEWISAAEVQDAIDPETKQPIKVDPETLRSTRDYLSAKTMARKFLAAYETVLTTNKH